MVSFLDIIVQVIAYAICDSSSKEDFEENSTEEFKEGLLFQLDKVVTNTYSQIDDLRKALVGNKSNDPCINASNEEYLINQVNKRDKNHNQDTYTTSISSRTVI